MKISLLVVSMLFAFAANAQKKIPKHKPQPKPIIDNEIILQSIDYATPALSRNDNGLRVIPLTVVVKSKTKPSRLAFKVDLLNLNVVKAAPLLLDSTLYINIFSPARDSGYWMGNGYCNIRLQDSSKQDETFYLIQKGDVSGRCAVTVKYTPAATVQNVVQPARNVQGTDTAGSAAVTAVPVKKPKAEISLGAGITIIHPVYIKDSSRPEKVTLTFYRDKMPDSGVTDTVILAIDSYGSFKPAFISPATIVIKSWDTEKDSAGKSRPVHKEVVFIKNDYSPDSTGMDAMAYVKIDGDKKNGVHELRLTDKGTYNSASNFWMETGANFDLLDGIKANNLYAGIYMFEKDITGSRKKRNVSFTGGVYESKSSSFAMGSDSGIIYRDASSYAPITDTQTNTTYYRYYRDSGPVKTTTNVQSIGIFFSPHLRLSDRRTNEYGFHMYTSLYLEMLWQRVTSEYDYSNTKRDSVVRVNDPGQLYGYPFKERSTSYDYRTQYIGVGLPIYITEKAFSLYINSAFGGCNQRFVAIQDSGLTQKRYNIAQEIMNKNGITTTYQNPKHAWNMFYLLQFRLTEETYGVVFTGEVRGFFMKNTKPVISLSLSKKFDLADLLKAVVKPFTPGTQTH